MSSSKIKLGISLAFVSVVHVGLLAGCSGRMEAKKFGSTIFDEISKSEADEKKRLAAEQLAEQEREAQAKKAAENFQGVSLDEALKNLKPIDNPEEKIGVERQEDPQAAPQDPNSNSTDPQTQAEVSQTYKFLVNVKDMKDVNGNPLKLPVEFTETEAAAGVEKKIQVDEKTVILAKCTPKCEKLNLMVQRTPDVQTPQEDGSLADVEDRQVTSEVYTFGDAETEDCQGQQAEATKCGEMEISLAATTPAEKIDDSVSATATGAAAAVTVSAEDISAKAKLARPSFSATSQEANQNLAKLVAGLDVRVSKQLSKNVHGRDYFTVNLDVVLTESPEVLKGTVKFDGDEVKKGLVKTAQLKNGFIARVQCGLNFCDQVLVIIDQVEKYQPKSFGTGMTLANVAYMALNQNKDGLAGDIISGQDGQKVMKASDVVLALSKQSDQTIPEPVLEDPGLQSDSAKQDTAAAAEPAELNTRGR